MRFNSGKFGASSPERERKLMSLAESSVPQSRKATKVSKSSYSLSVAASQSPGPSPGQARREERGGAAGGSSSRSHERSHSDTPPVPVGKSAGGQLEASWRSAGGQLEVQTPVLTVFTPSGLTAESSSVAGSLPGLRRGSVSSQDSQEDRRGRRLELPPRGSGCPPPPRPRTWRANTARPPTTTFSTIR